MGHGTLVFGFALLAATSALGASIQKVSEDGHQWLITQDTGRRFAAGDAVQVTRDGMTLAIAVVESSNEDAVLATVHRVSPVPIVEGDVVSLSQQSAQILAVTPELRHKLSHPINGTWEMGDVVCVVRHELMLGCGKVIESNSDGATVQLSGTLLAPVIVGDYVRATTMSASINLYNSKLKRVWMNQGAADRWRLGEKGCVKEESKVIGCGSVTETTETAAVLTFEGEMPKLDLGYLVYGGARTSFVAQVSTDQHAIVVTHHLDQHWLLGEPVCVQRVGYEIGCGKVTQVTPEAAFVTIESHSDLPILLGDSVRAAGTGKKEEPPPVVVAEAQTAAGAVASAAASPAAAQEQAVLAIIKKKMPPSFCNFSAGLNASFLSLRYEQGISKHISLGVGFEMASIPTVTGSLGGSWIVASFNYYGVNTFKGFWLHIAFASASMTAKLDAASENFSTLGATVIAGWRWLFKSGLNVGFGLGVNYIKQYNTSTVPLSGKNVGPSFALEVGYAL